MKSVLIISVVTFVLIFGLIVVFSGIGSRVATAPAPAVTGPSPAEIAAAERAFADLAVERDRVQRDRESLLALGTSLAAAEKMLTEQEARLGGLADSLRSTGTQLDAARGQAAAKLAKMYEAMKPDKAAPILASLDMDTILEVLRRMKERPAARILSSMDAALAAQISERLSERGMG